jgi:hypothetical protein
MLKGRHWKDEISALTSVSLGSSGDLLLGLKKSAVVSTFLKSAPSISLYDVQLCGQDRVDISLTVHSRAILKVVTSMCNGIKKIKCTLMKCHTNVNSIPFTQLPHKFLYIVAILIYNHFEPPNKTA